MFYGMLKTRKKEKNHNMYYIVNDTKWQNGYLNNTSQPTHCFVVVCSMINSAE